jgi:hypothetical protein
MAENTVRFSEAEILDAVLSKNQTASLPFCLSAREAVIQSTD